MAKSMTGYGRAQENKGKLDITVEVRSVNNRYFDCTVKIPRLYIFVEDALKSRIQNFISRGKVDVFVTVDSSKSDNVLISLNKPLLDGYISAFKDVCSTYGLKDDITASTLLRIPDIFKVEKEQEDADQLTADICAVAEAGLSAFSQMRELEGTKLCEDIRNRLNIIDSVVSVIEERSPKTSFEYRTRLEAKIKEVLQNNEIDEARIITEAAIFADRVAIDEELVRLRSHLAQLDSMLISDGAVGRKIDFLLQEINREVNTIGSKGNDTEIAKLVVDLKAEIEKIREQAQNIE